MQKIFFHSADKTFLFPNKGKLKHFIETLFQKEKTSLDSLRFIFCSDEYLLKINQTFLHHDYYTDIITFDLSEKGGLINGEIYISLDRVKENAATLQIKYADEILRVLFHGSLHLCGYKDKKKAEISEMRKKEELYLKLFKNQVLQ